MASGAAQAGQTAPGAQAVVIGGERLGDPGVVVDPSARVPPLPPITATSFVVADADTGDILAAQHAHQRLAPASTLKTLTALTLLPRLAPDVTTVAQADAPSVDGTKAGIVAGTTYTAGDLFTAMLMMSANDAAVALADANGGLGPTLAQMNAEAAHLQAGDTVAKTPNGLDAPGQSSSAYDLALIFRAGLGNPDFRHYLALTHAAFPAPGGATFQIQTHDDLLSSYPGMVGGKNGYTIAAQASYVGAATRGGHTIIVSMMRDQPNFWNEAKALLDWGFAAEAPDVAAGAVGTLVEPLDATPSPAATPADGNDGQDGAAVGGSTATGDLAGAGGASGTSGAADLTAARAGAGGQQPGLAMGGIATWTAVGAGGLVFLVALVRLLARRRRGSHDRDDRYLAGLSRLSALERVSDGP